MDLWCGDERSDAVEGWGPGGGALGTGPMDTPQMFCRCALRTALKDRLQCPPPSPTAVGYPQGCVGRGRQVTPPPLRGGQPMPSHCPSNARCQPQWHL